jgi:hypothetical protein
LVIGFWLVRGVLAGEREFGIGCCLQLTLHPG